MYWGFPSLDLWIHELSLLTMQIVLLRVSTHSNLTIFSDNTFSGLIFAYNYNLGQKC